MNIALVNFNHQPQKTNVKQNRNPAFTATLSLTSISDLRSKNELLTTFVVNMFKKFQNHKSFSTFQKVMKNASENLIVEVKKQEQFGKYIVGIYKETTPKNHPIKYETTFSVNPLQIIFNPKKVAETITSSVKAISLEERMQLARQKSKKLDKIVENSGY